MNSSVLINYSLSNKIVMSISKYASRFRDFVRCGSLKDASSDNLKALYSRHSASMPNLITSIDSERVELSCLDVAELDGDGARAILLADDSVFSSHFLGVNRSFCTFFGYDSCEFQSISFTKLVGATTDTKRLQAMWQEVTKGSDESCRFDLYDKSGAVRSVIVELLPRALYVKPTARPHRDGSVVVARIRASTRSSSSKPVDIPDPKNDMMLSRAPRRVRSSLLYDESVTLDDEFDAALLAEPISQHVHNVHMDICEKKANQLVRSATKDCLRPCRWPIIAADEDLYPIRTQKSRRASSALREAFPRTIAEAIMDGRRPEPILRDCVSVFFSDIVGFTALSSTLDATKVSDLLTRLFAKFDALAQLHGVQKIDVIGDAYLAATNVIEDQAADHAARLARFAIDAVAAAASTHLDDTDPSSPAVQIRVGLHSGPVSAAVVGAQGYKYTLFGDTVNTASRMESTSLPERIQCSAAAAALIADQDPQVALVVREGGVDAKGKGLMRTCWVGRAFGPPRLGLPASTAASTSAPRTGQSGSVARSEVSGGQTQSMRSLLRGPWGLERSNGLTVY